MRPLSMSFTPIPLQRRMYLSTPLYWYERGTTQRTKEKYLAVATEYLDVFSRGDVFRRKAVFLANVETNACLLQVNSEGLFVLGPQLISFVSWKIASNQSTMSKNVTTLAFPSFSAYVEPVCSASLPNRELLIFFWDGTYVKTALQEESEGLNSNKMLLVNLEFRRYAPYRIHLQFLVGDTV
ncbi:putative damage-specific DNA binding protein [Trypanosoma cruzi]|uniref:Putative damage-specific DNA binding protein n=1 Tax=Trypanosoma cruzi TaxID=5693 RepID=A0A2V2WKV3_TRYCR|nr:putative damage-specific DNA binding protein [Trypanosoma cruzi]